MALDPDAQTPTPDEIIQKGIDKLVSLRPRALAHINSGKGNYAKLFAGWRAQVALMCRRQADLAKNGRLRFAAGAPLRFLAGSEFDTPSEIGRTTAVGQVVLTRAGGRPGGTIYEGARFRRPSDEVQRLYIAAEYLVAANTTVPQGATSVEVPLVAARDGAHANRPLTSTPATELEIASDIFDRAAWTVTSYEVAGGSDGAEDEDIQRYAYAFAIGQHGPNNAAAIAGALKAGARHVIPVDDVAAAALRLAVADSSWASSARWAKLIRQRLYDTKFVGFGCKVLTSSIVNEIVFVEATCRVAHPSFLAEATALTQAIQTTLRARLDDRDLWNRWRLAELGAITSRADRRLLACTSLAVKRADGTSVTEPPENGTTHYMLLDDGVRATFLSPT